MFTTVRKSLGFIAPVIPSGKHLQQKDPIRACWRRYVCRREALQQCLLDQGTTIAQPDR